MELDSDLKKLIIITSFLVIIFLLLAIFTDIFSPEQLQLPPKKALVGGKGDVCASPTIFINCSKGLICANIYGKIITKYDNKEKYLGRCLPLEKVWKLQDEYNTS